MRARRHVQRPGGSELVPRRRQGSPRHGRRPAHAAAGPWWIPVRPRLSGPLQALAVLLVTAVVALVVLTWWSRRGGSGTTWDGPVAGLVPVVERLRGLQFDHPVAVDLLSAADMSRSGKPVASIADDGATVQRTAEALAAMGVGPADVDEGAYQALLDQQGTRAWYDKAHNRINVLGRDPHSPLVRDRLVQQLTFALQDQALGVSQPTGESPADQVRHALMAGDAARVSVADAATSGRPPPAIPADDVVGLGRSAVEAMLAWRGQAGLDTALRHPPTSLAALLDPAGWVTGAKAPDLRRPGAAPGEQVVARGVLGPMRWLDILSSPAGLPTALRAATGWGADAYVLVRRDGRSCLRATVAIAEPGQAAVWGEALQQWRASDPLSDRTVETDGSSFRVGSCVSSGPAAAGTATTAPVVWATIWVNRLVAAAALDNPRPSPGVARCAAIVATSQVPLAQLTDWDAPRADLLRRAAAARSSCQATGAVPALSASGQPGVGQPQSADPTATAQPPAPVVTSQPAEPIATAQQPGAPTAPPQPAAPAARSQPAAPTTPPAGGGQPGGGQPGGGQPGGGQSGGGQ